jgi:chromosome segregation ATPase
MRIHRAGAFSVALVALTTLGCGVKTSTHQKALDELALTHQRLRTAEAESTRSHDRARALEAALIRTRGELQKTVAAGVILRSRIDATRIELAQKKATVQVLRAKVARLEAERKAPAPSKRALVARIAGLEAELAKSRVHAARIQAKLEVLLDRERRRLRALQKQLGRAASSTLE